MNNKDADQSTRMGRLVCTSVVRMQQNQVFSRCDPTFKFSRVEREKSYFVAYKQQRHRKHRPACLV